MPEHKTLSRPSIAVTPLEQGKGIYTVEPPNNGHTVDEHLVHYSEVVPSSEVEMYGQYIGRGRAVCPL